MPTYVQINNKYRVSFDSNNYTLEVKSKTKDKKTGEQKDIWIGMGYFTKLEHAFSKIWKIELERKIKNKTVEIKEFIEIVKETKKEIRELLKDFE